MAETAKYCSECLNKLSPSSSTTPEDKAMLRAHLFTPGSRPIGKGPQTDDGTCSKCGKKAIVTFYEDSN